MRRLFLSILLLFCTIAMHAQTYFYHFPKWNSVVVVYFYGSNKIVYTETSFNQVREVLMSNMNAYESALSKQVAHGTNYDMNDDIMDKSIGSFVLCCDFYQTLSGYNIYGRMFKPAFMYGNYQKTLELGISANRNTVVRDVTANEHRYFNRVDKSFFLPSL